MDTDQTDTPDPTILTADEIAVLNAARMVCKNYDDRLRGIVYSSRHEWRKRTGPFDVGRVSTEAQHAEEHLFSLLSAAHIFLDFDLTHEQLHTPERYTPTGRTIPGDLRLVPVA